MVTKVGDDMFGENTIRNFASFGIDTRHVSKVQGKSSGVAPIMVEPSGENSILIVKGANADLLPGDIERAAEDLKTCSLILLQLEIPLETVYAAIEFGKRQGIETLLNPAPATRALDLQRILQVTFFMPNETELALLSGCPVGTVEEIEAAARSLNREGNRNGDRHDGGARHPARDGKGDDLDRTGPGQARRHHRSRRRLHRQLRALLR